MSYANGMSGSNDEARSFGRSYDDATSNSGTKFEIGSDTKLSNDAESKNIEEHAIASGGQSLSRSVLNQSNIDESEDLRPKILLMGLRRSGKSSIQKVVFHKMSPNETLFLESTNKIIKEDISNSSFVKFSIWDTPGQLDFLDPMSSLAFDIEAIFGGCSALIFVIDAQDDYMDAVQKLVLTAIKAYSINPAIHFEVFIHKVDSLSDETKMETQRDINTRALDEMSQIHGGSQIPLTFYLTSIYDHSIFEAFSKVVQKLIPQLPTLENLMNSFIQYSNSEKAFLFDVVSKIYIATDSSPVDMQSYELCCDMIDVVIDVSCIYGIQDDAGVETSSFDDRSASVIRLNNSTVLYLKEVDKVLALVCILREENFNSPGFLNHNFVQFREAVRKVFALREKYRALEKRGMENHLEPSTSAPCNPGAN